jgi:hypothetical protein
MELEVIASHWAVQPDGCSGYRGSNQDNRWPGEL